MLLFCREVWKNQEDGKRPVLQITNRVTVWGITSISSTVTGTMIVTGEVLEEAIINGGVLDLYISKIICAECPDVCDFFIKHTNGEELAKWHTALEVQLSLLRPKSFG